MISLFRITTSIPAGSQHLPHTRKREFHQLVGFPFDLFMPASFTQVFTVARSPRCQPGSCSCTAGRREAAASSRLVHCALDTRCVTHATQPECIKIRIITASVRTYRGHVTWSQLHTCSISINHTQWYAAIAAGQHGMVGAVHSHGSWAVRLAGCAHGSGPGGGCVPCPACVSLLFVNLYDCQVLIAALRSSTCLQCTPHAKLRT